MVLVRSEDDSQAESQGSEPQSKAHMHPLTWNAMFGEEKEQPNQTFLATIRDLLSKETHMKHGWAVPDGCQLEDNDNLACALAFWLECTPEFAKRRFVPVKLYAPFVEWCDATSDAQSLVKHLHFARRSGLFESRFCGSFFGCTAETNYKAELEGKPPGSYLIRCSGIPCAFCLTVVTEQKTLANLRLQCSATDGKLTPHAKVHKSLGLSSSFTTDANGEQRHFSTWSEVFELPGVVTGGGTLSQVFRFPVLNQWAKRQLEDASAPLSMVDALSSSSTLLGEFDVDVETEPEPEPLGTHDGTVARWLSKKKLEVCADALAELGYDAELDMVKEGDDQEVQDMIKAVEAIKGFKRAHVNKFKRKLDEVRSLNRAPTSV